MKTIVENRLRNAKRRIERRLEGAREDTGQPGHGQSVRSVSDAVTCRRPDTPKQVSRHR